MSTHTIDVHQDELEYTAEGLRTPQGGSMRLMVGTHTVVQITRPERVRVLEAGLNGFEFNSSFPTPGVLQVFLVPEFRGLFDGAQADADQFVQLFGHTDATGSESANKIVSERRAQAVLALLTADVEAFMGLAKEEGWGLAEAQVMLRVLRCDPGPPDGEMGSLTERAIEVFQNQLNAGMFHRHLASDAPSAHAVTKKLDEATLDALIDAFVSTLSPHLGPSQLHPTHPAVGCSEFNLASDDASKNRRVSIALYPTLPIHHDKAPCKTGDHTVCPVQSGEQTGCFWYREHFVEHDGQKVQQRHFDLRWLFIDDTRVLLSAITTVENGTPVEFRVYRSPEISELEEVSLDALGTPLSGPMVGTVLNGVAYCVWSFSPDEAAFLRHDSWVTPIPFELALGQDLLSMAPKARVPVFTVTASGARAVSPPPLHDVSRAVCHEDHAFEEPRYVWMTDAMGRVHHALFGERSVTTTSHALSTSEHAAALHLMSSSKQPEGSE